LDAAAQEETHAQSARMTPADFATLSAIAAVWGLNSFLWKIVVDHVPPLFASGARFVIVPLALLPFLRLPQGGFGALAGVALLTGPVHFGLQSIGLAMARDLAPMVIVMQLWIPASVGLAWLILGERVGALRLAGIAASFAGLAVMAGDPRILAQWASVALVAAAAVAYAGAGILVRRAPRVHPFTFQAWIAVVSAPCLLTGSAVFERGGWAAIPAAPWYVWGSILFAALASSIAANGVMFHLMQKFEMSRTTPFMFLSPVIGVGLGAVFMGDPLSPAFLLGGGLTMAGVAFVAMAERLRL
jgi:O-acetylserine/cysteine efflux transporter